MTQVVVHLPVADGALIAERLATAIRDAEMLTFELADEVVIVVPVGDITVEA